MTKYLVNPSVTWVRYIITMPIDSTTNTTVAYVVRRYDLSLLKISIGQENRISYALLACNLL